MHANFVIFRVFSPLLEDNDTLKCNSHFFSIITTYLRVYAELSELHFNVPLLSNHGEKVLKSSGSSGVITLVVYQAFDRQAWSHIERQNPVVKES